MDYWKELEILIMRYHIPYIEVALSWGCNLSLEHICSGIDLQCEYSYYSLITSSIMQIHDKDMFILDLEVKDVKAMHPFKHLHVFYK